MYPDANGRLQCTADARGNRIMDCSHAGYKGGGVRIPDVRVARTVKPIDGDNTAHMQAAIDEVSTLAIDANGCRGAVLLERGSYDVAGTLRIEASGVVLRGSGSGADGAVLRAIGAPHRASRVGGTGTWQPEATRATVVNSYVPSGASTVTVDLATPFGAGDAVVIQRAVTDARFSFMNMHTLTRDGKPQTWLKPGTILTHDRTIQSIEGNHLTFDAPLAGSFDAAHLNPPGTRVASYTFPGRIEQVGVESLRPPRHDRSRAHPAHADVHGAR